jgi:ribosome-associated heat shock protein Hsp15
VRTRTAAQALVEAGRVRLNGSRCTTPAKPVKPGDVLTVSLDGRVRVLEVTGFAERRGDADAASLLFLERGQTGGHKDS